MITTHGHDAAYPIKNEEYGLTKREYFAAMALQGFMANPNYVGDAAKEAVIFADELITALNEPK